MKYIFDFDDVLFNNTKQFKEHMFRVITMAGVPESEAKKYYLEVREKEFSLKNFIATLFSRYEVDALPDVVYETIMKECPNFLNAELVEAVRRIGRENCYIVTNGNSEFQKDKIKYSGIGHLFHEDKISIVPESKVRAIVRICAENNGEEVVFIDDKRKFIDERELKGIPNLTTIHYRAEDFGRLMKEADNPTAVELKRRK